MASRSSKTCCKPWLSILMIAQVLIWFYIVLETGKTTSDVTVNLLRKNNWQAESEQYYQNMAEAVLVNPLTMMEPPREIKPAAQLNQRENDQSLQRAATKSFSIPESSVDQNEIMKQYFNAQLGHTILPRNASIVLEGNFLKNPVNLCRQHEDLDLAVVVHTAPYNFQRRQRLRQVFGDRNNVSPYTVQLVFAIGTLNATTSDASKDHQLDIEYQMYGDFVQMDFQENFRNLSYKAVTWLRWLDGHCTNALMVLKIDDDVILDLRRVLPLSRGLFSKYKRSMFCNINPRGSQPIPRKGRTKVDFREFAGLTIYPYTYCSGFIVFLSRDLIPLLAQAVKRTPFYNVDDLFMFGIVPKVAGGVTYHNLGYNVSLWHNKVFNCTVLYGSSCRYFGTMAQHEEEVNSIYGAFDRIHMRDFHFPQLRTINLSN